MQAKPLSHRGLSINCDSYTSRHQVCIWLMPILRLTFGKWVEERYFSSLFCSVMHLINKHYRMSSLCWTWGLSVEEQRYMMVTSLITSSLQSNRGTVKRPIRYSMIVERRVKKWVLWRYCIGAGGVGPQNPPRKWVLRIKENAQMVKEKKFLPDFHMEKLPVFFIRLWTPWGQVLISFSIVSPAPRTAPGAHWSFNKYIWMSPSKAKYD